MISVSKVNKSFAKFHLLKDVSFEVKKGSIFGLLGPNGAGKTTLIKVMCGILQAQSGSVKIDGKSVESVKNLFGYVSQSFGQYEELSVWENITFYAQMYGIDDKARLEYLLQRYNLTRYRDTPAGKLSGGYQRRLALVAALVHNPEVLFLDEPTAGIDPVTRKLLWDDFYSLSVEGKTLFITTHYMEEAQRCDELAFLASGEIVTVGTPSEIKNGVSGVELYTLKSNYNPEFVASLSKMSGVMLVNQFGDELRLLLSDAINFKELKKVTQNYYGEEKTFVHGSINLEDVFILMTQELAV